MDLTEIIVAVIGLLSAILTGLVIPVLKNRLDADKFAKLVKWTDIAVSAAEQIYRGPGRGAEKLGHVHKFLNEKGLTFDREIVESCVQGLGWTIEEAVQIGDNG